MMKKSVYEEHWLSHNDYPEYVEKIRTKCFICGKRHLILAGTMTLSRLKIIHHKGIQYFVSQYAPLGCYLAHAKKSIEAFYKDKDWCGWKQKGSQRVKKEKRMVHKR